jgi:hypothetical protein
MRPAQSNRAYLAKGGGAAFRLASLLAIAIAASAVATSVARENTVDVASWVAAWPTFFTVKGGKSEPTYVEAIDLERDDDVFSVLGGAPAWEQRAAEAIAVDARGGMRHVKCPVAMTCDPTVPSVSFLSSAALLAAYRAHRPLGRATPVPYGERRVICLPAERIGVAEAVLDPCFDLETGAVLAQRHRLSGRFDGPSLDPGSVRVKSAMADKP